MEDQIDKIVSDIYEKGWAVLDGFVSEELRAKLLEEQQRILKNGQFKSAGVGRGDHFQVRPEIRSDKVFWMEPESLTPLQDKYWKMIDDLRIQLNRKCFLGLRSFESHFAIYPVGSFYKRHLDQFKEVSYRIVSVVLYLNESWNPEDEGALRIYIENEGDGLEHYQDILPLGGRLVVFMSGEIPHEVLPTRRERISITGWLKNH